MTYQRLATVPLHADGERRTERGNSTDIADIKARHHLGDVARRSGIDVADHGRAMVCCPTPSHPDTTPSTLLDLDQDRYHCFGCGAHGDVIDWVRDVESVDLATAISILES